MKISERSRSALETPLNEIFSSEGSVRILRELSLAGSPLSKSELARRTGVSLAGVVKALPRLVDAGVVTPVGTGRRQVAAIREEHPLSGTLRLLFRTEALQKQQLTAELTRVLASSEPPVRAAWLHDGAWVSPRAPLGVGVLVPSADVRAVQDSLRPKLAELSARFGISLELLVTTAADVAALPPAERERLEAASPLYGPNPLRLSSAATPEGTPGKARTHADREAESVRRAMWVADLLDRDPALPRRARQWIVHRLHTSSAGETADLQDWLHLLESATIPTLQYVLLRIDERSDRLRQTNPFLMVLSPDERSRMVKETAA
jgi:DNA-binding transcriptional ArsR family regulator